VTKFQTGTTWPANAACLLLCNVLIMLTTVHTRWP
jgi:hypothetical protein